LRTDIETKVVVGTAHKKMLLLADVMLVKRSSLVEVARRYGYDRALHSARSFLCCALRRLHAKCLHKAFYFPSPKHIVTVFGAPFKVVEILAYAIASAN